MLDFHGKGAGFKRDLMGDVQDMVGRMLSNVSATIAAQQSGVVKSDQHRVLNFQGSGVTVTDDPLNRRANVVISGGTSQSSTSFTVATAPGVGKALNLWTGSSNSAPPANWQTAGFSDAGWAATVAGLGATSISGSVFITSNPNPAPTNPKTEMLVRQTFTAPTGTPSTVTLIIQIDEFLKEAYLNGTAITPATPASPIDSGAAAATAFTYSIDPTLIIPGATNLFAFRSLGGGSPTDTTGGQLNFKMTIGGVLGSTEAYVCAKEQQSTGTQGGGFTSGAWRTRTLNVLVDPGGMASLASNQVTLPAGTFRCAIRAPAAFVKQHMARLQNITAGTTLLTGTSEYSSSSESDITTTNSFIGERFTLSASSALEVQHQCNTTRATNGFGAASSFTVETYTVAEFWKVG